VTAPATPILEIDRLALSYSARGGVVHAVQDASLVVANGESVGIAGESGSGKSTLARAVLGLLPERVARITNGRIVVAGRDVTHLKGDGWRSIRGNPVAIVFQDPLSFLNPVLRVGAQIAESVRRHDPAADLSARSVELLRLVRLEPAVLRRYPHELSGGMRQRVMLAIALGCRPRLLIADEPTTALDVTTQAEILALLRELRRTLDMSLLVISHDLGLLRWNCDRVYVMYAGHAVESGPTEAVMTRPAHPYTQGLIAASRLDRQEDGHFATVGGDVPGLHRRFTHCPFAPRCPSVMEICRRAMPPFLKSGDAAQEARCWLLDPAVASEGDHARP
jgi:oligopeptide/dipeptide ABC transporter ATP-binding protein